MAKMRQNKNFIYLVVEPNEILHKTIKFKKDETVNLGAFIIAAAIIKARQAGLDVKNNKECMLVFSGDRYVVGIPKTIAPDPEIFSKDLPMLSKIELL